MKCPNCGAEITDDSRFCEFCGVKVQAPCVGTLISKFECTLMIVLGLISTILTAVLCIKGEWPQWWYDSSVLLDVSGALLSSIFVLFFVLQLVRSTSTVSQRIIGFCGIIISIFIFLRYLLPEDSAPEWLQYRMSAYINVAFGLLWLLFAGTVRNFSKYVIAASGVMWCMYVSGDSWFHEIVYDIFGILTGAGLLVLIGCWLIHGFYKNESLSIRVISVILSLVLFLTFIVSVLQWRIIVDEYMYSSAAVLPFVLVMISGVGTLLLSLSHERSKTIYFFSVIFVMASMMYIFGRYMMARDTFDTFEDITYAATFLLPISIVIYYVASLTGDFVFDSKTILRRVK